MTSQRAHMFDRGQYQMGAVASTRLMERDAPQHRALKSRVNQLAAAAPGAGAGAGEREARAGAGGAAAASADEALRRLKDDLERRERALGGAAAEAAVATAKQATVKPEDADAVDADVVDAHADATPGDVDADADAGQAAAKRRRASSAASSSRASANGPGEDDEDVEEELRREVEKIKQERREREERVRSAGFAFNPLLPTLVDPAHASSTKPTASASGVGAVRKRWDDDVVFRNQARDEPVKAGKRFINDTTKSDEHRVFLKKFVR